MSQIFSSIFKNPGGQGINWGNIANLGLGALGTIGNISANKKRNALINEYLARQRYLQSLTPEQHLAGIRSFQNPLSGGLTKGVGNVVQGAMAERGLSQSPSIYSEVLAQALAPYFMQNQESAKDAYFRSLGVGGTGEGFLNAAGLFNNRQPTVGIWQSILASLRRAVPSFSHAVSGLDPASPDPGGGLIYSQPSAGWWDIINAGAPAGGGG